MSQPLFNSITGNSEIGDGPASEALSVSFSTGAGAVALSDVKLGLYANTPGDGGSVVVVLESNASNTPGATIATLGTIEDSSLSGNVNTPTIANLILASGPDLTAGTRYWIGLVDESSSVGWDVGGSTSGPGVSGEYQSGTFSGPPFFTPMTTTTQNSVAGDAFFMEVNGPPCFCAGTRLATPGGSRAVEALRAGDEVLVLAPADGALVAQRVRWMGRRALDLTRHARPEFAAPIRIRAHAFGPDLPVRDLLVSPDHALFVDGALMPAHVFVNGATVVQEYPDRVSYFHVELERHSVLLAEGLPAESYLDTGNRGQFDGEQGVRALHPGLASAAAWGTDACAPLATGGPRAQAARAAVRARVDALGYVLSERPDFRVLADGKAVAFEGGGAWLPPGTREVRLLSRRFMPVWFGHDDWRRLGVALTSLRLDAQALPESAFGGGWHAAEPTLRWTDGDARLLLAPLGGSARLAVATASVGACYWDAPRTAMPAWRAVA